MEIDNIHKIHAPKIQGVFSKEQKRSLRQDHSHGVLGGTLKSMKIDKHAQDRCSPNAGACFLRKNSACSTIVHHEKVDWQDPYIHISVEWESPPFKKEPS